MAPAAATLGALGVLASRSWNLGTGQFAPPVGIHGANSPTSCACRTGRVALPALRSGWTTRDSALIASMVLGAVVPAARRLSWTPRGTRRCPVQSARRAASTPVDREAPKKQKEQKRWSDLIGDRPKVRYIWQVPQAAGPEVVLVGRSNAGKSTLLNAVLGSHGEKQSAPTSQKGGRTRTLNWYPVGFQRAIGWEGNGVRLHDSDSSEESDTELSKLGLTGCGCCLVDCFGLGPVDYSLAARRLQTWGPLLHRFISERRAINTVCHLISAEQEGVMSEGDEQLVEIFNRCAADRTTRGLPPYRLVVVLTKIDLYGPDEIPRFLASLEEEFRKRGLPPAAVVTCSSLAADGQGILDFTKIVQEADQQGWARLHEWVDEANRPPRRTPAGRTEVERKKAGQAFFNARKQADNRPPKGGPGSVTELPPSL